MSAPNATAFNVKGMFYPLVVQYVTVLVAMKELAIHGTLRKLRAYAEKHRVTFEEAIVIANQEGANLPADVVQHRTTFELYYPMDLRAASGSSLPVNADSLADELAVNFQSVLGGGFPVAAGSLLVVAYEASKAASRVNHDPLWEFLRHCRNAASHGNRFNFPHGEPRRPATWGNTQITAALAGTCLFRDASGAQPLLEPGDPIHLLWEIEQAYP